MGDYFLINHIPKLVLFVQQFPRGISANLSLLTKHFARQLSRKKTKPFNFVSPTPPPSSSNIQNIINTFRAHLNVDLQQRAVEFSTLFTSYGHLRAALLEKMPTLKISDMASSEYNSDFTASEDAQPSTASPSAESTGTPLEDRSVRVFCEVADLRL